VIDRPWRLVLATTEVRADGSSLDAFARRERAIHARE
jgi:hypothetical protein